MATALRIRATMILSLAMLVVARRASASPTGADLYAVHCARCHGSTARGDGPDADLFRTRPPDLLGGFVSRYPTEDLVRRIRQGVRLKLALDPGLRRRAVETEQLVQHLERLPIVNWRLVERGEELFVDRCEICHGPYGRPSSAFPPGVAQPANLSEPQFQKRIRDDAIAETVRRGHGSMPGLVPRIAASDVPAVVAFVRLLSPGYEQYSRYCAACHGDDGRGPGIRFGDTGPTPTVVFDAAYFARTDPERVRASVWHMVDERQLEMPHLGKTLDEAEARAIVTYLKRVDSSPAR